MDFMIVCLVIGFGGLIVLAIVTAYFNQPKCPNCKKRKCYLDEKVEIESERISIKKEEKIKHYNQRDAKGNYKAPVGPPDSVSIRKYTVPGVRIYYAAIYICRNCGNKFSRREQEDREI